MNCPACSHEVRPGETHCPYCGKRLSKSREEKGGLLHFLIMVFSWLLALAVVALAAYKLYFWIADYRLERKYTRGTLAPAVTEITMADGRAGHAIIYYGSDGDKVFFEDLNRCVEFSGGVARLEIPDSDWFGSDIEEVESAKVTIASTLLHQGGEKQRLPELTLDIAAPESPIDVISPAEQGMAIHNSIYNMQLQVVPGSKVNVNGKDVTDIVDRTGLLSVNVNVFPIGDNVYSIIVDTPNHKQARKDVVIFRQKMEIAVELNNNVPTKTNSKTVTISGKCDLGATISVDSKYMEGSLKQNEETGEFNFIAEMEGIGVNNVIFRASQPGKADSAITLDIDYMPSVDEYGDMAWAMDYKALCTMFVQWKGQPFRCPGVCVDTFDEDGYQYIILDVGTDGTEQLLALRNYSKVEHPEVGHKYNAFADVEDRYMYKGHYYPMLNARYIYE